MRKVPDYVTCVCKDCVPGKTPYCWRCNRNPKVARVRSNSLDSHELSKER